MKPKKSTMFWQNPKSTVHTKCEISQDAVCWVNLEKHKLKDYNSDRPDLTLSSLMDSVHADYIGKKVSTRQDKTLHQNISSSPHPQSVLLKAWQVQHDKEVQWQWSTQESCAEGNIFKIDFRAQGAPQSAVFEDQGRMTKIQNLVHTLRTQSRRKSVITDHKKTGEFNMFEWRIQKDRPKLRKERIIWIGRSFYDYTVPTVCQVSSRRIVTQFLEKMIEAFEKEQKRKTKKQFDVLPLSFYVVQRNLSRGAKQWRSEENNVISKRMKDIIFVHSGDFRKMIGWTRKIQVVGFAHTHWFLVYSYAERALAIWKQRYSWH